MTFHETEQGWAFELESGVLQLINVDFRLGLTITDTTDNSVIEIQIETECSLTDGKESRTLTPSDAVTLSPVLRYANSSVGRIEISRRGSLRIGMREGALISAAKHDKYEAFQVGCKTLGLLMVCAPGGKIALFRETKGATNSEDGLITQFREIGTKEMDFLSGFGFERAEQLERTSPTFATLVYLGTNVGLVFSFDVRDKSVDAEVVRVREGRLVPTASGGYSRNLLVHLIEHAQYRDERSGTARTSELGVEPGIKEWAEVLKRGGKSLLRDAPDSLPRQKANDLKRFGGQSNEL